MRDRDVHPAPQPAPTSAAPAAPAAGSRIQFTGEGPIPKVAGRAAGAAAPTASERAYVQLSPDPNTLAADDKTPIADIKTTGDEATLLNEVRARDKRFDPVWLLAAQQALGVRNASGAFNTDTLRAFQKLLPKLTADDIVDNKDGFLTKITPGEPFITTATGFGARGKGSTGATDHSGGTTNADQGARALGYTGWTAYHADIKTVTFLGKTLSGTGAHAHLRERLAVAEKWLRQKHHKKDDGSEDAQIIGLIGWSGEGNASYGDTVGEIGMAFDGRHGPHMHAFGLAIDIDPKHNPYVFDKKHEDISRSDSPEEKKRKEVNNWWVEEFERQFKLVSQLYGGDVVSPSAMADWSRTLSTEELFAKIHEASGALKSYLVLAETGTDAEILDLLDKKLSQTGADAKKTMAEIRAFGKKGGKYGRYFQDNLGREKADSLTTHTKDLLVALRDVAGLSWGGTEMSNNINGDFMHFDCRQDSFGKHLYTFALANHSNPDPPAAEQKT